MNDDYVFPAAIIFMSGILLGWGALAISISSDCPRLGGFTLGGKTYVCEVKK